MGGADMTVVVGAALEPVVVSTAVALGPAVVAGTADVVATAVVGVVGGAAVGPVAGPSSPEQLAIKRTNVTIPAGSCRRMSRR
ncbi:MAG: hypothetical protein H0X22_05550 [Acidimicrobiia bacterium]|nr:hypothetical protein [Acidimicrobiia bacterium]